MSPIQIDVGALATRLGRLAIELDECVHQLTAEPLSDGGAVLLTAPALHIGLVLDELENALYLTEKLDQSHRSRCLNRIAA